MPANAPPVRVALGSDVGGGTGFSLLKEALLAYPMERQAPDGVVLSPAALLYLCTRAGAEALGLADEVGDLSPGKAADFIWARQAEGSMLAEVLAWAESPEHVLGARFALAREESVGGVYVAGQRVWPPEAAGAEDPDRVTQAGSQDKGSGVARTPAGSTGAGG